MRKKRGKKQKEICLSAISSINFGFFQEKNIYLRIHWGNNQVICPMKACFHIFRKKGHLQSKKLKLDCCLLSKLSNFSKFVAVFFFREGVSMQFQLA